MFRFFLHLQSRMTYFLSNKSAIFINTLRWLTSPTKPPMRKLKGIIFLFTQNMNHVKWHRCEKLKSMTWYGKQDIVVFHQKGPRKIWGLVVCFPKFFFFFLPLKAQLVSFICLWMICKNFMLQSSYMFRTIIFPSMVRLWNLNSNIQRWQTSLFFQNLK